MKPVIKNLPAAWDPWKFYAALYERPDHFFLYSSQTDKTSRFSYLGCDPIVVFKAQGTTCEIIRKGFPGEKVTGNPFDVFEKLHQETRSAYGSGPSDFFCGGWVGYWGYENKHHLEKLDRRHNSDFPDALWMAFDAVIVHDHEKNWTGLIGTEDGIARLENLLTSKRPSTDRVKFSYSIHRRETVDSYGEKIAIIKNFIADGRVYEANLTQRFDVTMNGGGSWRDYFLFKELSETSPAPYSAILKTKDLTVLSSSPELFLKTRSERLESKPIKGTRARTGNFDEDERRYHELRQSEKDRAENLMIVDLVRNDLGRISKAGSIEVKDLFAIETYATVFQMVSTIASELEKGRSPLDALKASFPPGSMTGAPKISAMNILEQLETSARGVYSGVLGYLGWNDEAVWSVVIRTLILSGDRGYFQTGGAIVWDSVPEEEFRECLDKAKGILSALERSAG